MKHDADSINVLAYRELTETFSLHTEELRQLELMVIRKKCEIESLKQAIFAMEDFDAEIKAQADPDYAYEQARDAAIEKKMEKGA